MTTHTRRQYQDVGDWDVDHGEEAEPVTCATCDGTRWVDPTLACIYQPCPDCTDRCAVHGVYTPTPSGDCVRCLDDADDRRDQRTADYWTKFQRAERADAAYTAHDD